MPKYQVIGEGKFDGIKAETIALSENKAIRNVAFRLGIMEDYYYFKSNVKVIVLAEKKPKITRTNFSEWIKRRKD